MEKFYRGPYIDAYWQVWFHLAQLFQRRRLKYEKVNGRTMDDNTSHGPGELKNDEKRAITPRRVFRFTARTARFSKKSPWSVFFRSEMSLICHNITVKCR
jgi:hypothetical protein